MVFERLDSEDQVWSRSKQLRDQAAAEHATITYTVVQMIFSLVCFKRRMESKGGKLGSAERTTKYNTETQDIPGQKGIAEAWSDAALTVWERLLSEELLRRIAMDLEEEPNGGPLNSVYKLNEVVKIGRATELLNIACLRSKIC